jgi:hypothetical protein
MWVRQIYLLMTFQQIQENWFLMRLDHQNWFSMRLDHQTRGHFSLAGDSRFQYCGL